MQAAKTVYTAIAVFLLIPWMVYQIKAWLDSKKDKKKFPTGRLLIFVLVSAVIIAGVYFLYDFTIGYQAPLVAEQAGDLFTRRLEGKLDFNSYLQDMEKRDLFTDEMGLISDEEIQQAGFETMGYRLSISERTYPMEDGTAVIYLKHEDDAAVFYTVLTLRQSDYQWQVLLHDGLTQEDFDALNEISRIRFLEVKTK